jgi:hypothetical protein
MRAKGSVADPGCTFLAAFTAQNGPERPDLDGFLFGQFAATGSGRPAA